MAASVWIAGIVARIHAGQSTQSIGECKDNWSADIRLHRPDWLQCVHDTDGSHTIGTRWQIDDEKANLSAKSFRCVARDVAVCNRERMNDEACGHRGRHVTDCKVLAPNLASRVYTTRFTREIHVNGSTFTHHRGQSGRKSGVEYQRPSFAG